MSSTKIWRNDAAPTLRALVLACLDQIVFRHHGIGVLQGYVVENAEPEIRVHIWSRKLLKPGMDVSGDIHDHRFDMVSHVLAGAVEHEELLEFPDPAGSHVMMSLTHARAAADTNYHGPTTALDGRYSVRRVYHTIKAGESYSFPAERFHHSPLTGGVDEVAVTVVEKHKQRETPARLLYPVNYEPVMAFGHEIDQAMVASVIALAKAALESAMTPAKSEPHTAYDCREFRYERGDSRCVECGRKERYVAGLIRPQVPPPRG